MYCTGRRCIIRSLRLNYADLQVQVLADDDSKDACEEDDEKREPAYGNSRIGVRESISAKPFPTP